MQKRVYTKDLELNEILQRLNKGEKLYYGDEKSYFQKIDGFLINFANNIPMEIQDNIRLVGVRASKYFLDEVEEPEADESCIGKLCELWTDKDEAIISILQEYRPDHIFKYVVRSRELFFQHCRPLTKEEALDFIKE